MATYKCRICGSSDLHKAIDLGMMPNANNLVTKRLLGKVKLYPMAYYWCGNCTLLQQAELAPRTDLFNKDYPYVTGVNTPSVEDFKNFCIEMKKRLPKRNFAVVLASNDGTEIRIAKEAGGFAQVIGVDPAGNLARIANERGLFTINDFFGFELSQEIVKKYGNADFVVAKGVFAHIPDPRDMLSGMKNLINDDGTIAIEVHYMKSLIESTMIDTLYAEHYFEWTIKAMKYLANDLGLRLTDVEYLPGMRGGSLRVLIKKHGSEKTAEKMVDDEAKAGIASLKTIEEFQDRTEGRKRKFTQMVRRLKAQGNRISVWTASAKVPTLLNYCGLSRKELDYAYDITNEKIGKYIPKVNIEIKKESLIEKDMPDYLILGSWNYIDVAMEKFERYMSMGGRLINPLTCEIISKSSKKAERGRTTAQKLKKNMIAEGKKTYDYLMSGKKYTIKDVKVVSNQNVGHLHIQELFYKVKDVEGYWTKVLSHGERANGVTVVPIIRENGKEYIIMLLKPHPVMKAWNLALPSGAMKTMETEEECAARELEEEAGLKAQKLTWLMSQCNFPERIGNVDTVFVADATDIGSSERDYEERPMKAMAFSISEVAELLDKNKIQAAMVTAILSTYLQKRNPLVRNAFRALKQK